MVAATTKAKETLTQVETESRSGEVQGGPVARLLAKVSRLNSEYTEYQMEAGIWRKLAL